MRSKKYKGIGGTRITLRNCAALNGNDANLPHLMTFQTWVTFLCGTQKHNANKCTAYSFVYHESEWGLSIFKTTKSTT